MAVTPGRRRSDPGPRGVQGGRVVVTVRDTVVVLEGEVDSDAAWVSAARVAWAVPGISDVANRLVVRPTPS
ncbi:BON domain-containing protein [Micromonosporaceae bacterium Da 78-11]